MMADSVLDPPFQVKDCALVSMATGLRARSLSELRDILLTVHPDSIYYHFWGERLRPHFEQPEYHNHFAGWADSVLHDEMLAEKLGIIDPKDYANLEDLRHELVEVVEQSLEEKETIFYVPREAQFHFIQSRLIVFDTNHRMEKARDLVTALPMMSDSSIFYHFIDARRRTSDRIDDFSSWLKGWGDEHQDLLAEIRNVDPYFLSLEDIKKRLMAITSLYFLKR